MVSNVRGQQNGAAQGELEPMLNHVQGPNEDFNGAGMEIINAIDGKIPVDSFSYRLLENENESFITTRNHHGVAKIVQKEDGSVECIGKELNPLAPTFSLMYQVLPGATNAFTIKKDTTKVPSVDTQFEIGTDQHAHEICATMEEVTESVFATSDNDTVYIACCFDADPQEVANFVRTL